MRTMRQARALARAGHSVTIVAYRSPDAKLAAQGTAVTLLATGAPLYPIWLMGRLWLKGRLLRDIAGQRRDAAAGVAAGRSRSGLFAQRAAHRLAERSFDVVQAHFDKALIAAAMLARPGRSKLVFDAVEVPFDGELVPKGPTARELRLAEIRQETEIARHADGWITVNDTLADAAVERFGIARPLVLRNLQDEGYRPPDGRMRRDLGLDANAIVLLHLNTMRSGEGLETAVDALAQLPTTHHLVVLGPVPRRSYLRAMRRRAAALGVAERFHLAPMQPPHAVPAYIAGANIGIIARESSLQNMRMSLPNRLFQMIAARLPVVVTPLP
jgi:glycosyltransferase involved in cell wall biosynthesis